MNIGKYNFINQEHSSLHTNDKLSKTIGSIAIIYGKTIPSSSIALMNTIVNEILEKPWGHTYLSCIHMYTHKCMQDIHTCTCIYTLTHMHMYIYVSTLTRIHTYIHTHTHIHTHTEA